MGLYGLGWLLALGAVLVLGAAYLSRRRARHDSVRALRESYLQRLHLPAGVAEETLLRQLEDLHDRQPGRSMAWYLRSLHQQLDRDRR